MSREYCIPQIPEYIKDPTPNWLSYDNYLQQVKGFLSESEFGKALIKEHQMDFDDLCLGWFYDTALVDLKSRSARSFEKHSNAIRKLDLKYKGAARYLQKNFRIRCFGRYPISMLERQYEERGVSTRGGVVMCAAYDKENTYGGSWKNLLTKIRKAVPDSTPIRIVEVADFLDIAKMESFYKNKKGVIPFLYFAGHGSSENISLVDRGLLDDEKEREVIAVSDFDVANRHNSKKFANRLARWKAYFDENTTFILDCCSAGDETVQENIAHAFCKNFEGVVISGDSLGCVQDFEIKLGDKGQIIWNDVKFSYSNTKIYKPK